MKRFPAFAIIALFLASSARSPMHDRAVEVRVTTLYEACVIGTDVPPELLQAIAWVESRERDDVIGDGGQSFTRFQLYEFYHADRARLYGEYDVADVGHAGVVAARYLQDCLKAFPGDLPRGISAYNHGIAGARRGIDWRYVEQVLSRLGH
jgi:hypothetical protein